MNSSGLLKLSIFLTILTSCINSSHAPAYDMWMSLDEQYRESKALGNTSDCIAAYKNIIDHLKNASFQTEVASVLDNTGKMFNDIGYYQSCMQNDNLTYYLIRPRRTDLKTKFNFGVCAPKVCSQDDISTLIAENYINKRYLAHIANGTENDPQDYNSTAMIVPTNTDSSNSYLEYKIFLSVLATVSICFTIAKFIFKRKHTETKKEDTETSQKGIFGRILNNVFDSFNLASNWNYLMKGIKNQANTLNLIKLICGMLIIYSGEYSRRHFLGIHQDDKEGLERFKESAGFNLVYFSALAFDVLFFVSGATNTLALMTVLQEKKMSKGSLGTSDYATFYIVSIVRRFLRLAPLMYLANIFYYKIIPTQLSNPLQYLFSEDFSKSCPSTFGLSFSFFANIVKGTEYCAGFTWYLQSDFQMFLLLPFILIVAHKQPYLGKLASWCVVGTSLVVTLVVFIVQSLSLVGPYSTNAQVQDFLDLYQTKPWGKLAFYFAGSIVAVYLLESRARSAGDKGKAEKAAQVDTNAGSVLTKDIEHEAKNRFGNLGDDQKDGLKEKLVPKKRKEEDSDQSKDEIEEQNTGETDESYDWSWIVTFIICIGCIGIVTGLFIGFIQFSKTKDSWSTFSQVMYSIGTRILIIIAVSIIVIRMEYPFQGRFNKQIYTNLGVFSTFSLAIYLWHNLFVEWDIATMPVNQYYEPLLIVYYCLSTLTQISIQLPLLVLLIDIPFRRLVSHTV